MQVSTEVLNELVRRLVQAVSPRRIIAYAGLRRFGIAIDLGVVNEGILANWTVTWPSSAIGSTDAST